MSESPALQVTRAKPARNTIRFPADYRQNFDTSFRCIFRTSLFDQAANAHLEFSHEGTLERGTCRARAYIEYRAARLPRWAIRREERKRRAEPHQRNDAPHRIAVVIDLDDEF
jgi:hypothetical protein